MRRRRSPTTCVSRPALTCSGAGQFEYLERATAKLKIVVPVTLLIIFLLLFLNFGRLTETVVVMLSLPFALVGGLWLMWWLGFNMSVAVVVGFIALAGVAAETGVVMLMYLDQALNEIRHERETAGQAFTRADLNEAIMLGAVERVRPKMMTVVAIMAGLIPILWSTGTGSEVMQRIAVPMIGGMVSSTLLTLIVIPAIYALVKGWGLPTAGTGLMSGEGKNRGAGICDGGRVVFANFSRSSMMSALTVIGEDFYNPALIDAAMSAARHHAFKFCLQRRQAGDTLLHLR